NLARADSPATEGQPPSCETMLAQRTEENRARERLAATFAPAINVIVPPRLAVSDCILPQKLLFNRSSRWFPLPLANKQALIKAVILCGGLGTRLREETEFRPKPMVPVGERPILWHIMKTYAHYGHKEFILCLGYKGEAIKDYFRNYHWNTSDVTLCLGAKPQIKYLSEHDE